MTTLRVPGASDLAPTSSPLATSGHVVVKRSLRVQASRAADSFEHVELAAGDVLEIELADGLLTWTRSEDAAKELRLTPSRSGGALAFPSELDLGAYGPQTRGVGAFAIKALRVLGIDIAGQIGDFVKAQVEGKLVPRPGLYRCDAHDIGKLKAAEATSGGPTLVMLHGTASSTAGSFEGLWTSQSMQQLTAAYGGRVLAFQHRTLSESPIENALELVRQLQRVLPRGSQLHVLSHSRGGLVGELLARSMRIGATAFTRDDLALFDGRKRDQALLRELGGLLSNKPFTLDRFVRVACPARGTTLAAGRLDRYFGVLVNLLKLTGLGTNPVFDATTSLLAAVLKLRTDPKQLPGLEAMMPDSPLIALLNHPDAQTAADLHVLGGDLEGQGIWSRLQALASDFYYREDHDLVVNTKAMLGGTTRRSGVRYWLDTGPDVTHFNYFKRTDTARRIVLALTTDVAAQRPDDFHSLGVEPFAVTSDDYRKRAPAAQPIVFVVPGIMGSALSVAGANVWIDVFALANGGLSRLASDAAKVSATGLVRCGYDRLCEHLKGSHEVVTFAYDWRLSLDDSAELLRRALDEKLTQTPEQPLRILAHSMGGLVVCAMLATPKGLATWQRMLARPGSRVVMLGTPSGGSHAMAAMLLGRDALVAKLSLLDLRHNQAELLETLARFDGVLQLLPGAADGGIDYFDAASWDALYSADTGRARGLGKGSAASDKWSGVVWTRPGKPQLKAARAVRKSLQQVKLDPARTIYVAGVAEQTPCKIEVDGTRVRVLATAYGDGRVPWATGIPDGLPVYYMDAAHGDMADEPDHFDALQDLLATGSTAKLEKSPPQRRSAQQDLVEVELHAPEFLPDQIELAQEALGGRAGRRQRKAVASRIRVRVVHDDLTNATAPVLVGHYQDDVIVAAEAYLDQRLERRLSELHRMELYAGPLGKSVVVLNEAGPAHHPGAVVVGLGHVGELTPGGLTQTLTEALTQYGADRVGRERRRRQRQALAGVVETKGSVISAPLVALLVGSGGGGVTLADSVQCLLRAVSQANQRLAAASGESAARDADTLIARIDRLDIFEVYEDRAIEAVHVLRSLARTAIAREYAFDELLARGRAGQRRARYDTAQDWWQRIRVVCTDDGGLTFEALTQRARADASRLPSSLATAQAFIKAASASSEADPRLGQTLFELLVPADFKVAAPDRRKLALVLDPRAAALPWELLQDRADRGARPISVETGMIRQLRMADDACPLPAVVRASQPTALVIGNPLIDDPAFPPLPGAEAEAEAVSSLLLAQGFQTTTLLGANADAYAVLSAVHEQPWRILHLAAHGVFEYVPRVASGEVPPQPVTGLVMSDGLYFTAETASQMRVVPDLVFVNCCNLGNTERDVQYHRIAANLATQFIQVGARVVIAAGWAVDDRAAKLFATTLYTELFAGARFGDAVQRARVEVFSNFGHTNTWGAYQCYGDTEFSLGVRPNDARVEPAVAPVEVSLRVRQLTEQVRQVDAAGRKRLLSELEQTIAALPQAFWETADLPAAVGGAFSALGELERALSYYERAFSNTSGEATLQCVEQWANLASRVAKSALLKAASVGDDASNGASGEGASAKRARASKAGSAAAQRASAKAASAAAQAWRRLPEAEAKLRALLAIAPTPERYAMLGSLHKTRAMHESGPARLRELENMIEAYGDAYESAKDKQLTHAVYGLTNMLAGELTLGWCSPKQSRAKAARTLAPRLTELGVLASRLAEQSTTFFELAGTADCALLESLFAEKLGASQQASIAAAYEYAAQRGAVASQLDSLYAHVEFYTTIAEGQLRGKEKTRITTFLKQLRARIELIR